MKYEYKAARRAQRGWWWSPEWGLLNAVLAGLLAIYVGAVMYLASAGLATVITWANVWAYLLIGLGAYLFVRSVARYFMAGRWGWFGGILAGLVLLVIGTAALAASLTGWTRHLWAIVIVAGGFLIIAAGIVNYLLTKR